MKTADATTANGVTNGDASTPPKRSWHDLDYRIKELKDSEVLYEEYQTFCDRYATFVGRNPWRAQQKRMELLYSKYKLNHFVITDYIMEVLEVEY